jgi:Spectrin repeat
LKKAAKVRRGRLEDAKFLFQLWADIEEEEAWLVEKQRICQTGISAKDLRAVLSLQQKHKVGHSFSSGCVPFIHSDTCVMLVRLSPLQALQDELKARWPKAEKLCDAGRELMSTGHPQSGEIAAHVDSLQKHWKELRALVEQRKSRLEEAAEAYQVGRGPTEAFDRKLTMINVTSSSTPMPTKPSLGCGRSCR